tara:strand:- start:2210 stop:2854 length:645 start_codon:yes stop_codon:yes gene_type:complete
MPTYRQTVVTYPNPTKRFLFVHIPRTAGRFLEENFKENGFEAEQILWKSVDGIEVAHFHNELYLKHFDDLGSIPHFTVVRNPVDRFMSCSIFLTRMYGDDIQEAMEDPMMFGSMLQNFPLTQAVNWFRPQIDFLTDDTNIWKFEDGFGSDFDEWMSEILGVEYTTKDVQYEKLAYGETKKLEKTAKLVNNIMSLYRKDYEYLYPELATPLEEGT